MSFSADELDTVLKNRENIDFSPQAMSLVHRLDNANEKYRAEILGEIVGYGSNCDAYHITAPEPEGEGAADAIRLALHEAKVKKEEISYINAHGTSTELNDYLKSNGYIK